MRPRAWCAGNCRTVLVATLSPAQEHAQQTAGTCSFAESCRGVRNGASRVAARRVSRQRPWAAADASAAAARRRRAELKASSDETERLPWVGVQAGDAERCPGGRVTFGSVSALAYGDVRAAHGVALALHGNPSEALHMRWLAPALVHAGYYVICPDMPGFGQTAPPSTGRMATRSEQACESNGPAEVVEAILGSIGVRNCVLVGYDWGAGTAIAMAASSKFRRLVHKIVCMHPAYAGEKVRDELRTVKAPTLVMWAEDNVFHSWPKFKPLALKLRQRLGDAHYAEYRAKRESDAAWGPDPRARAIVKFLTGLDPLPQAQTVAVRPEESAVAADGSAITQANGIVFRRDVTEAMARGADRDAAACVALIRAQQDGKLRGLLRDLAGLGGSARASAMARFARELPSLDEVTISPGRLHALGLWSEAALSAGEALQAHVAGMPRYFRGRRVLLPGGARRIGALESVDVATDCASVSLCDAGAPSGGRADVSWCAVLLLNQRHSLPSTTATDGSRVMRLEDGMWADFGSPLLRAELASVALALEPIFARDVRAALDANDDEALDAARTSAIRAMRGCLDVTSFARAGGMERGRDRARYAKDDAAKMAAHGEGHCRTCSSCFAPFLWAFAELIAVDPHYCTDDGARQYAAAEGGPLEPVPGLWHDSPSLAKRCALPRRVAPCREARHRFLLATAANGYSTTRARRCAPSCATSTAMRMPCSAGEREDSA